jgi:outer membrane immunogenic protein
MLEAGTMRLKLLAAAIAGSVVAGGALAADLPTYKAPPAYVAPPPVWSWTGCHVGANIGYGWQANQVYDPQTSAGAGSDTSDGLVGGGQVGCDYQASTWVLGVQGMLDGAGVNGSHIYPPPNGDPGETLGFNTSWVATETGRIGYLLMPQALAYFRGGLAEAGVRYTDVDPNVSAISPYSGSESATRVGWTIGGGVEYSFARNWSVFAEYDYIGFGSQNATLTYTAPNPANAKPYTYRETNDLQTLLVGLNFKFDWTASPAPVSAKY